jgi:hypothetical protein
MINQKTIIVEFSVKQNAFHKNELHEMILTNIKTILKGIPLDYLPIGAFETHDQADEFIKEVYDKFKK